jgi:hypothetical protein
MVGRCLVLGLVGSRPVCTLNGADESAMNPEVYRILRDTLLARTLKEMHQNQCQVCGESFSYPIALRTQKLITLSLWANPTMVRTSQRISWFCAPTITFYVTMELYA